MTKVEFVDLRRQYAAIKDEVDDAVLDAIGSTAYILGPHVERFEEQWASYSSADHCVGVASGTAAVELSLQAVGVGSGDEVIAPANTFIATIAPILRLGAQPVLVDCDEYGQIDVGRAADAVTSRTRAIVGVHLFGHPCDADELQALCAEHDITFVEDAAQAHGAEYKGRRCGSLGRIAAFSFYPAKNLGAYGDAGAVVTSDRDLAEDVRLRRDLGQRRKYEHAVLAGNERLDALQAAVLQVKLHHLDRWNELRRQHASAYSELLGDSVLTPAVAAWAHPVWHLYVIRVANRDALREILGEAGIGTGIHYPIPVHLQPALAALGHREGDFPNAEEFARTSLSLPMFPELEASEVERVSELVSRAGVPVAA
jgi:dTDP-4-amino-4,6-dideoxygalactose transaminase